jgi:hypothetical protein
MDILALLGEDTGL